MEKSRRQYNLWVATENIEDYSLRYAPASFRKWSPFVLANTALGGISFLALEAIGATLLLNFGFENAVWAIALASLIIFLTGIPISYYCARYNIDIDLLTRSAGFGYVGSTVTSLVYASFTFIFFALEAAIMAQALLLYFHLPLFWGYILSSIIIIPIVFYGVTAINRLHRWTQPLWLILMLIPFYFILTTDSQALEFMTQFKGEISHSHEFNWLYFGVATGISFALIAQIGEQVDYLRFMPDKTQANRTSWWASVLLAGPGWVILGFLKQMGGVLLASVAVLTGLSVVEAKEPVQMYAIAYRFVFENPALALAVSTLFVLVSQIKINVTNAYAGSLAWSNFFSRLTHAHPGRVVWLFFNIGIALLLMELGVFDAINKVLGLYSNVAIAWVGALVADLVINKPFKLSPPIVEFKRAHLYNFNPVGFGSMLIASAIAIVAFTGVLGDLAQAYSWLLALMISFILSPMIAYITQGKYYIQGRENRLPTSESLCGCAVCEQEYVQTDCVSCPYHKATICSLCCTLETSCKEMCHQDKTSFYQRLVQGFYDTFLSRYATAQNVFRTRQFLLIAGGLLGLIASVFWLTYQLGAPELRSDGLASTLMSLYFVLGILMVIFAWWIVLVQESQAVAEINLNEQNLALEHEVKQGLEMQDRINQLAFYDELTGLPNRRLLIDRLNQLLARTARHKQYEALLFIDLDRFKSLNDSLGHDYGDLLLKIVAERLLDCVRKGDTVARLGGDEFVVLLEGVADNKITTAEKVEIVGQNILSVLNQPCQLKDHGYQITLSIGALVFNDRVDSVNTLLKQADIAMYHVKKEGRNALQFFDPKMQERFNQQVLLEQQLRQAIEQQGFELYYQVQFDEATKQITGAEALIRWHHPEKGLVSPFEFIPLAEENGLIVPIGAWVLDTACAQLKAWEKNLATQHLTLSVNVSAKQFSDAGFVSQVKTCLQQYHINPKQLKLELTENILVHDIDYVIETMTSLKALGVCFSLDDFGTGYSSLQYLQKLPLQQLKIDKSFVDDILTNENDASLIQTIIAMSDNLGLELIAEGVETEQQRQLLVEKGCVHFQGYLFGHPVPIQTFEAALKNQVAVGDDILFNE